MQKKTRRGRNNKNKLKKITILFQNVRGIKCKWESMQIIAEEYAPSIICLVETHLGKRKIPDDDDFEEENDNELEEIDDYKVIRKDRECGNGGGCLIAIRKELKKLITEIETDEQRREVLMVYHR